MKGVERMKSFFVIVNPHANFGKAREAWNQVKEQLSQEQIDFRSQETNKPGDAQEYTKNFLRQLNYRDYDNYVILVVGGTGTLNEVLTGIKEVDITNMPLGFISVGQHHQFAQQIGIARNPLVALKQVLNATEAIDYSLVQYYEANHEETGYFLNNYSIGINALLSNLRKRKKKSWLSRHLTKISNFITLCSAYYNSPDSFKITVRIGHKYKFYKHGFIINLRNHAHEADFSNDTDPLDLIIVDKVNIFVFIFFTIFAKFKNPANLSFVHRFKAHNLHLTVNSLEQTEIDSREVGGKYNDLYIKIVKYPFWINIDSVSLKERRKK